ncbi:MAG: hypothetical protein ACKO16_15390 [Gemmataceae bacterium]
MRYNNQAGFFLPTPSLSCLYRWLPAILAGMMVVSWCEGQSPSLPNPSSILKGHNETIYSLVFSPNGKQVVTGSFDKTIKVWDAVTGKEIRTLTGPQGHKQMVLSVAVNPDGSLIASGSSDNNANIWDYPMSDPIKSWNLGDVVHSVVSTPDGTKAAAGLKDGSIRLWKVTDPKESFKEPVVLKGHQGPVLSLLFVNNGLQLVSGGADGTLRTWNVADGKAGLVIGAHVGAVTSILSRDGGPFTSGEDGTIKSWNILAKSASSGEKKHSTPVVAFSIAGDGSMVATASSDSIIRIHTGEGLKTSRDIETKFSGLNKISLSPDKKWVAAGNDKGVANVWSVAEGKLVSTKLVHPEGITSLEFAPQSNQFMTMGKAGLVKVWQIPATPGSQPSPLQEVPLVGVSSQDGKKWIWAGAGKQIRMTGMGANNQPVNIGATLKETPFAILPGEGDKSAYVGFADGSILLQNAEKKEVLIQAHKTKLTALANPSGMILTSGDDGYVRSWKPTPSSNKMGTPEPGPVSIMVEGASKNFWMTLPDGSIKTGNAPGSSDKGRVIPKPAAPFNVASFSHDAQVMVLANNDTVQVIKSDTKKETRAPVKLPAAVRSLVVKNDGKQIIAGLADGKIAVIESEGKAEPKLVPVHTGEVVKLEFSPAGLVSIGADKALKLTKTSDWSNAASTNLDAPLNKMRISPSGKKILLAMADKSIRILDGNDLKSSPKVSIFGNPLSLAFDNEEKKILAAIEGYGLAMFSPDGITLEYLPLPDPVLEVGWSTDNSKALAVVKDKGVLNWSPNSNWSTRVAAPVNVIAPILNKDVSLLGCDDGKLILVKNVDGKLVSEKNSIGVPVKFIKSSRDGSTVAIIGKDGKTVFLAVADLAQDVYKPLAEWNVGPVNAFELASDGKQAALVLEKETAETARVYDVSLAKEIFRITGEQAKNLQFLQEPRALMVVGKDALSTHEIALVKMLDAGPAPVKAAAYGATDNVVWTFGEDKIPHKWDITTGKETLKHQPIAVDSLNDVVLSRDGTMCAVSSGKNVKVWKTEDGKDLWVLGHPKDVVKVAFSPDKTKLVTTCQDGIARTWDLLLGREQQFFDGPSFNGGIAFSPTGTSIHAVGGDGALHLHNLAITKLLVTGFPVRSFAFGQGGQVLWAACDDKILRSWNLGNNMADKTIEAGGNALRVVAISPNGQVIATGGLDPEVRFFQASDLKPISSIKVPGVVKTITYSKDQIVAVGTEDGSIQMLQVPFNPGQPLAPDFGNVVQTFNLRSIPNGISFCKEGKVLFSADSASNFSEWKIAGDAPQKSFPHPNFVDSVAFDPKGLLLATGCHDGKVRLFDITKGNVLKEIDAHTKAEPSPVYNVLWTNDGKRLISCSMQGSIKAWDVPAGSMAYEIKAYKEKEADNGHKEGVFSLAISPDQSILATAGGDRVIKLWNLQDGKFIRNLVNKGLPNSDKEPSSHPGWIYSLRFTPDGKHLLAVGGAPKGKGVLTQWKPSDGSLEVAHEVSSGVLYSLSINPDAMSIATSAGSGKPGPDFNQGLVIKLPGLK